MDGKSCYQEAGLRIKKRREELGLTMEQVGKRLGINKSTVKRYEDGVTRRITIATYEKLAEILDTTVLYLMEGVLEKKDEVSYLKPRVMMHPIPILGVIRAGNPVIASTDILGYTYIEDNNFEDFFALKVKGDSMDLVNIKEDSVVVCHKQDYVENGDIAVVLIDNEDATVKRVYVEDSIATLMPQSSNPENKPIIVNLKEQAFKIMGRVVKVEYYM